MNAQNLTAHKKMLAIIIGAAIFATAGMGAASAQQTASGQASSSNTATAPAKIQGSINIEQLLLSNVKTDFSTAANTAKGQVANGTVIGGGLKPVQGYLVYSFKVVDGKNMVYSVIVDPSTGSVLYTSPGHAFHGFGMGHAGGMKGGFKHGGQGWGKQQAAAPSSSASVPPATGSQ